MSSPTSVTLKSGNAPPDHHIRAKLLHKLGIYGASPPSEHIPPLSAAQIRRDRILRGMGVGSTRPTLPPDGSALRNPLQGVIPVTEPLKDTLDEAAPRRRIMFEEQVQVMPIPTRYEYSERIKSRIWSNRHELQENAERNAVEFAAEGWNWRNVTEDDGMYICSQSGELVHPIHLKHLTLNANHNEEEADNQGAPVELYDDDDDEEDGEEGANDNYNSCSLTRGKPVDRA